jgi:hypothetical protein
LIGGFSPPQIYINGSKVEYSGGGAMEEGVREKEVRKRKIGEAHKLRGIRRLL